MTTYKGLPGPHICDYWTREDSAANYDDGSSFQIGRIDMVANTGTYLDAPFHRYADGADLAALGLEQLASLPGLVVRTQATAIDADAFAGRDVAGKAVLVHTGWDRHWRTQAYQSGHPFLTEAAARSLVAGGARLVGNRQPQYRRYKRPLAPRPHRPARRRRADLRAYDQSRRIARRGLHLHRRPPEDRRHGHLPGAGLCCRMNKAFRANKVSGPHQSRLTKGGFVMLRIALPLLLLCAAAPLHRAAACPQPADGL